MSVKILLDQSRLFHPDWAYNSTAALQWQQQQAATTANSTTAVRSHPLVRKLHCSRYILI